MSSHSAPTFVSPGNGHAQTDPKRFVIVGGGLAGHNAAIQLRKLLPQSSITLIGGETGLPYDRPPLTKGFLSGELDSVALVLKQAPDYAALDIQYHAGTSVAVIDRGGQSVAATGGADFAYDALLLATGSRPRRLQCCTDDAVLYMRTLADAVLLRRELAEGRHVVVIGGGFIGLEVAATAVALGCRVTIVEAGERLLARGIPPRISEFVLQLHRSRGVNVLLGEAVTDVETSPDGRRLVKLSSATVEADIVVVGIGVVPNVELAAAAGLDVDDGIVVDNQCRTSDPAIFAAGEVTAHPLGGSGPKIRLESWQVASKQSLVAASGMAGLEMVFDEPPWLWSDQFGVNVQCIGAPGAAESFLFRGDTGLVKWTLLGVDGGGLPVGAIAVNNGRDISMMRRWLRSQDPPPGSLDFGPVPDSLWRV